MFLFWTIFYLRMKLTSDGREIWFSVFFFFYTHSTSFTCFLIDIKSVLTQKILTGHFYSPSRTGAFPVISSLQESDGRFTTDWLRSEERLSRLMWFSSASWWDKSQTLEPLSLVQGFCEARLCGVQSLSLPVSPAVSWVSRPVRMSLIEKDEKLNVMVKVCARIFPALSRAICLDTLTHEPLNNKIGVLPAL